MGWDEITREIAEAQNVLRGSFPFSWVKMSLLLPESDQQILAAWKDAAGDWQIMRDKWGRDNHDRAVIVNKAALEELIGRAKKGAEAKQVREAPLSATSGPAGHKPPWLVKMLAGKLSEGDVCGELLPSDELNAILGESIEGVARRSQATNKARGVHITVDINPLDRISYRCRSCGKLLPSADAIHNHRCAPKEGAV